MYELSEFARFALAVMEDWWVDKGGELPGGTYLPDDADPAARLLGFCRWVCDHPTNLRRVTNPKDKDTSDLLRGYYDEWVRNGRPDYYTRPVY